MEMKIWFSKTEIPLSQILSFFIQYCSWIQKWELQIVYERYTLEKPIIYTCSEFYTSKKEALSIQNYLIQLYETSSSSR